MLAACILATPARAQDFVIGEAQAAVPLQAGLGEAQLHFAIAPQPLESALNTFTAATGIQVFYSSALADGRTSPGVTGMTTPYEALRTLLSGTALVPVASSPDAVTLVLNTATLPQPLPAMAAPPAHVPVLPLGTLRVEVPTVRGYEVYATTVRYKIQSAILADQDARRYRYRAAINVWVSPGGSVQHSEIFVSTGDRRLDALISQIVQGMGDLAAPPSNLPQPLHVRISAQGAS